jgi:hypothetical protein
MSLIAHLILEERKRQSLGSIIYVFVLFYSFKEKIKGDITKKNKNPQYING